MKCSKCEATMGMFEDAENDMKTVDVSTNIF